MNSLKVQKSPNPLRFIQLADIAEIFGGYAFRSEDFGETGLPVVKIANIEPPTVNLMTCERIMPEKVVGLEKYCLQDRDIVIAMTGATIGKVGRIRSNGPAYLNQRVAKITAKAGRAFDDFLFAVVTQPNFSQHVINNAYGSAQANVSAESIGRILIPYFSSEEQLVVGQILGTLDDKIELNRRMNETLEDMARAIFKSWFVDFDPVRAKAERRDTGLPKPIADLFPDSFEASELGEIPKGWRIRRLPDVIEVNPLRSLRKGTVAPYLDMANMPTDSPRPFNVYDREYGSGMRFINGDTLVARITPCLENGKTCFVDFLKEPEIGWGSTEFIVLRPKTPLPVEYAYFLARTEQFRSFAISNMTGTSGRQRVSVESFAHLNIVVPSLLCAEYFGKVAKIVLQKVKANDEESRTLTAIRDALLPKLLSGEIRVKDAEKFVEGIR